MNVYVYSMLILCVSLRVDATPYILISELNGYLRNVTCVVNQFGFKSALNFIFPLRDVQQDVKEVSFYSSNRNGITHTERNIICNFEPGQSCIQDIIKYQKLKVVSAGSHKIAPVTDKRWETFNSHFVTGIEETGSGPIIKLKENTNLRVGMSVRGEYDPRFSICDAYHAQDYRTSCYWFLFDSGRKKSLQMLRKCTEGLPRKFPTDAECKPNRNEIMEDMDSFSEKLWTHILLTIDNGNITVYDTTTRRMIMQYYDHIPIKFLSYMHLNGYDSVPLLWKIHQYDYLSLTVKNEFVNVITIEGRAGYDKMCVSLYAATCAHCTLDLVLENNQGFQKHTVIQGVPDTMSTWETVVFIAANTSGPYGLLIKGTTYDVGPEEDEFWAVDDIRFCDPDEITVYGIEVSSYVKGISCESLEEPTTKATLSDTAVAKSFHCEEAGYIGPYCNITCQSVLSKHFCQNKLVCQADVHGYEYKCLCAPGSKGKDCKQDCSKQYYGYECRESCGHCEIGSWYRGCNVHNGQCASSSCVASYMPPLCKEYKYPKLLVPPVVIDVGYDSVIFQLQNITTAGYLKPKSFKMQYRQGSSYSWSYDWEFAKETGQFALNETITIHTLDSLTSYSFRAILFDVNNNYFIYDDLPEIQVKTRCKAERPLNILAFKTQATITFKDQYGIVYCPLNSYHIVFNGQTVYFNKNGVTLNQLLSYTKYNVTILSDIYNISWQETFTTLEAAPTEVTNLHHETITNESVIITWDPPEHANGVIKTYKILYRAIRNRFCGKNTVTNLVYESLREESLTRKLSLNPYTDYEITVSAITVEEGPSISLYITTKSNDYIDSEELPQTDLISIIAEESKVVATWTNQQCLKIKGPLSYKFHIECGPTIEPWCINHELTSEKIITEDEEKPSAQRRYDVFENLIPFTGYKIQMFVTRTHETWTTLYEKSFKTKESVPSYVGNLTAYSKNGTMIWLRWKDPYPPYGQIQGYTVQYKYSSANYYNYFQISNMKTNICVIWDSYNCHQITGLQPAAKYDVKVLAKNKNVESASVVQILVTTSEEKSTAPINFKSIWENHTLNLSWEHPDITNGPIRYFYIHIKLNETQLQDIIEDEYTIEVPVTETIEKYEYQIKQTIPYSTSYKVSVCAVNKYYGENATLIIDTPPEKPSFMGPLLVDEDISPTNSSFSILIPKVNATTISLDSFIFIVIQEAGNGFITNITNECLQFDMFLALTSDSTDSSWIASELKPSKTDFTYLIGDNTKSTSNYLGRSLWNKELKPDTEYEVYVILLNQYKSRMNCNNYKIKENIKTTVTYKSDGGLWALLILLLIPIAVYVAYRYNLIEKYKNMNVSVIAPNENVTGMSSPDIIPLTTAVQAVAKIPPKLDEDCQSVQYAESEEDETHPYSRLVPIDKFENYIKEALESGELQEQHAMFPKGQTKPWDYGMLAENKMKNRYKNLIAYDSTRVKLRKLKNDPYSDYINANYINGYRQPKAYIATQGPKTTTVNDFWRMIWQEKVKHIIMLANIIEGGKKKCEQYWPDDENSSRYGNVEVRFLNSELYADFVYRTFDVICYGETRKLEQYHFTSWPDHGVPIYPQSLATFLKKVLKISHCQSPTIVHCSAGVGRTGTVILCDICLRMAAREGALDVFRYLHDLREQRASMVDNIDQYKLVHLVLMECLLSPAITLPCNNLKVAVNKLLTDGTLQNQLHHLQEVSWQDNVFGYSKKVTLDPHNKIKNRFPDIVPDVGRIYLPRYPADDTHSDYINAVPVDGFRFKDQFIVTQTPLPNTLEDFWRMVAHKDCKIIVSLNDIPSNDETCCNCWPQDENIMEFKCGLSLRHSTTENYELYDIFSVILNSKSENKEESITIIQFKNWKYDTKVPQNMEEFVTLAEEAESLSRGKYPTIVMCYDGSTACGLYVCFSFMIEKMKLEQECDAYLAVRVTRRNRKSFICDKIQLEFLYSAAVKYLNTYETYANFQPY